MVDSVPLKPKSMGFDIVSRANTVPCTFQVIPIRGFRLIVVLTYTPTHKQTNTHTHKVIAKSAPPYYVVSAENNIIEILLKWQVKCRPDELKRYSLQR